MGTAEVILVFALGIVLLLFLILGIVATVMVIIILRNLKRISERAEQTTDNVADLVKLATERIAPAAISSLAAAAVKWFMGSKAKHKKED